jgi:hypothetical protein
MCHIFKKISCIFFQQNEIGEDLKFRLGSGSVVAKFSGD